MDDTFTKRVRAAAAAGWWTVLIAYVILLIQWLAYLTVMSGQPAAWLSLWGGGATWPEIRMVWLWGMVAFKLVVGTMFFAAVWLTLWARRLAKT